MGRWMLILVGPLPATVLLLPFLFAGGLGEAIALGAALVDHRRSGAERWATVATTGTILLWVAAAAAGVLALWVAVLAGPGTDFSQTRLRWWLVAGLMLGLFAAARWLWTLASIGRSYDALTWARWLGLLAGPLVLGGYYVVLLLRH
jgi:hypothetical protein